MPRSFRGRKRGVKASAGCCWAHSKNRCPATSVACGQWPSPRFHGVLPPCLAVSVSLLSEEPVMLVT